MTADRAVLKPAIYAELAERRGADNAISMQDLFTLTTGETLWPGKRYDQTRLLRSIIKELRENGMPICNKAGKGGGYFWAETEDELNAHLTLVHRRAISSLSTLRAMKNIPLTELFQQLELDLDQSTNQPQEQP